MFRTLGNAWKVADIRKKILYTLLMLLIYRVGIVIPAPGVNVAYIAEQVNINLKYEGYIERQLRQVEHFKKLEKRIIPETMDYTAINGLRVEAMQKLEKFRPHSIGQASRISGVSPADISVLLVYMEQFRRRK